MKSVNVKIEGTSPYLMHKYSGIDDGSAEQRSKTHIGAPDYSKEADKALYKLPDGTIYVPAAQLEGAMIKAAVNEKIPGRRGKTYKDLIKAFVFVEPDAVPMKPQKWESDIRAVVVQRNRVVRHRPKFNNWSLEFTMSIHEDEQVPAEVVQKILVAAGQFVGIGDYRPRYGRFRVEKFEVV